MQVAGSDLTTSVNAVLGIGTNSTLDTHGRDATWSGQLSGSGAFSKVGAGTLTFTDSNIYTGGTTVAEGVLRVSNSLAGGVIVNGGATLAGVGPIAGLVQNGGNVSPGNSPGTLTVGSYTQAAAANLMINILGLGAGQFSVLNVMGSATLNGTLQLVLGGGYMPMPGDSFVFMNYGDLSGFFLNPPAGWTVDYGSVSATLTRNTPSAVPDYGSTLALLISSFSILILCRRLHGWVEA